jgi:NADH-quinone oxidoreductase subunit N
LKGIYEFVHKIHLFTDPLLLIGMGLLIVGFGFKVASVPFHMWAPDVYEGAPLPITAFLSVGPKAAGFAVLIRFLYTAWAISGASQGQWIYLSGIDWPDAIAWIAALTMTVGNLAAIAQTNLKRLLAYSSIAQAGYMLVGVVCLSSTGLEAVLFYVAVYLFMNLGAFLVIMVVKNHLDTEEMEGYKGLGVRAPLLAGGMTIFLFALTG